MQCIYYIDRKFYLRGGVQPGAWRSKCVSSNCRDCWMPIQPQRLDSQGVRSVLFRRSCEIRTKQVIFTVCMLVLIWRSLMIFIIYCTVQVCCGIRLSWFGSGNEKVPEWLWKTISFYRVSPFCNHHSYQIFDNIELSENGSNTRCAEDDTICYWRDFVVELEGKWKFCLKKSILVVGRRKTRVQLN